ncbi:DUF3291 domain-containing protein [Loktanella sp. TSTF-M6]|uniref:DUF3291 domain-containing protein n=1 Tax=Loktanella gaetbuli TaxID=2881335 RepID=A0ABS8BQY2_9RHOB|nr:DUF3291 domain-containing protein [Loktanella gaetbuli]MCB5198154.1 DUF3291 domain-containing protein [Loktanella gaetbuli]
MHLAELNIGRLIAPTDDPRVAEFMDNLDRINGLGKRMPGFVWMMEGSGEPGTGNTEAKIDGDPQFVANLTVWADFPSLRTYVFDTLHARFMNRRAEWFKRMTDQHFVMWPVPVGHKPTLSEALARLEDFKRDGDTPAAFGWTWARANLGETSPDGAPDIA